MAPDGAPVFLGVTWVGRMVCTVWLLIGPHVPCCAQPSSCILVPVDSGDAYCISVCIRASRASKVRRKRRPGSTGQRARRRISGGLGRGVMERCRLFGGPG